MDFMMNHILAFGIVGYSLYQVMNFFRRKTALIPFLIKTSVALLVFLTLFFIEELAQLNTVFLSRALVLACLVAFSGVIFLLLRKSNYFVIVSVATIVLIYLTMQSVMVPSSEITSDPNTEVLIINPAATE